MDTKDEITDASAARVNAWQERTIDKIRQEILQEFHNLEADDPTFDRLTLCVTRIRCLQHVAGVEAAIRQYIYVMFALITHERTCALKPTDVKQLLSIGQGVLKASKISPLSRKLGYLYGDLHSIYGQILRRTGKHWDALWQQGMSMRHSGMPTAKSPGFDLFVAGNRALRLGNGSMAVQHFKSSLASGLGHSYYHRCQLALATALRLIGNPLESELVIHAALKALDVGDLLVQEFEWQRFLIKAKASGSYVELIRATERGGSHHEAGYVIENILWQHALSDMEGSEKSRRVQNMVRSRLLRPKQYGYLFEAAQIIQDCYDSTTPMMTRTNRLGECLARRHLLMNIDKELLVLAGAVRWLSRTKSFWLAAVCLNEYQALSMRLTDGKISDALGLFRDLESRDWPVEQGIGA